jgi:hypothetical protein
MDVIGSGNGPGSSKAVIGGFGKGVSITGGGHGIEKVVWTTGFEVAPAPAKTQQVAIPAEPTSTPPVVHVVQFDLS